MKARFSACVLALFLTSASAFGADISGKWTLHVKFHFHNGDPWFEFKQDGEKLGGMYHGYFGDLPLTGSVKGNQIDFTVSSDRGTGTYHGELAGDVMKGTAKYPFPLGTGHFEGKRKP